MKPFVVLIPNSITKREQSSDNSRARQRVFLGELEKRIKSVNRPRIVLDCSELGEMGMSEVRLLVSCLERVMTRNGDARLAGVSAGARETLSYTGAERLFQIYEAIESAVRSYESHRYFEVFNECRGDEVRRLLGEGNSGVPRSRFDFATVGELGESNEICEEKFTEPD